MAPLARRRRRTAPNASPLLTRAFGAACLAGATTLSAAFVTPGCCAGFYGGGSSRADANVAAAAAAAAAAASSTTAMLRQRNADGLGGSRHGTSRHRRNQFAMASAIAEAPTTTKSAVSTATAADALTATTNGRRQREARRTQPLTVEEERALLSKIKEARLLRGIQRDLELASVVAGKAGRKGKGKGKAKSKGRNGAAGARLEAEGVARQTVPTEVWAREAGLEVDELSRILRDAIEAKQTLVERNLPMVIHMVNGQYRWRLRDGQVSTADLIQEGAYALGVAADSFDPSMPNRFLTYALYTVRDKLDIAVARGNSAISVPASALKELQRARRDLAGQLGRSPSEAELAHFFANGVVADRVAPALRRAAAAERAPLEQAGESILGGSGVVSGGELKPHGEAGRDEAVRSKAVAGEFSIKIPADDREARQQARIRRRRLNLLSAVQKVTSIDRLIRASDGSTMVPLVDTLVGDFVSGSGGGSGSSGGGDMSELLPRVLTPRQAELVRMACGLADGRPMSMAECSKELSLSLARTKSLFDSSLETLRHAAAADNPSRLVRQP